MEDFSLLNRLDRVMAPPDFEQRVLARLSLRKRGVPQRMRVLRISLASAAAALLICVVLLNVFVLQKRGPVEMAGKGTVSSPEAKELVPIIESVNYSHEIRGISLEPQTVYLLEQVSEVINTEIKY